MHAAIKDATRTGKSAESGLALQQPQDQLACLSAFLIAATLLACLRRLALGDLAKPSRALRYRILALMPGCGEAATDAARESRQALASVRCHRRCLDVINAARRRLDQGRPVPAINKGNL
jgi:hypothetical protein